MERQKSLKELELGYSDYLRLKSFKVYDMAEQIGLTLPNRIILLWDYCKLGNVSGTKMSCNSIW